MFVADSICVLCVVRVFLCFFVVCFVFVRITRVYGYRFVPLAFPAPVEVPVVGLRAVGRCLRSLSDFTRGSQRATFGLCPGPKTLPGLVVGSMGRDEGVRWKSIGSSSLTIDRKHR